MINNKTKNTQEIPIRINDNMVVYTDDPKKIPSIKKKFKKYLNKDHINEHEQEKENGVYKKAKETVDGDDNY